MSEARRIAVLDAIGNYIAEHDGRSPSYTDLQKALGFQPQNYVYILMDLGLLVKGGGEYNGRHRQIVLTDAGRRSWEQGQAVPQ